MALKYIDPAGVVHLRRKEHHLTRRGGPIYQFRVTECETNPDGYVPKAIWENAELKRPPKGAVVTCLQCLARVLRTS